MKRIKWIIGVVFVVGLFGVVKEKVGAGCTGVYNCCTLKIGGVCYETGGERMCDGSSQSACENPSCPVGDVEDDGCSWESPCIPSCSGLDCGGSDGCGGTCSNADDSWSDTGDTRCTVSCGGGDLEKEQSNPCEGNNRWVDTGQACNTQPCCSESDPDSPVLNSPSDGVSLGGDSATLDWGAISNWGNGCPNSNSYKVYVEEGDVTPDVLVESLDSSTTSYDFTGSYSKTYYWKVVADNGSRTASSSVWSFDTADAVEGIVYDDPYNVCSSSTGSNFGGGMTAELRGTVYSDSVAGDGTFAIVAPTGGGYTLDMTTPSGYVCSSSDCRLVGCPAQTSVVSPSVGNNFFFTQLRAPWWQVNGGAIYTGSEAGGVVIKSNIPVSAPSVWQKLVLSPDAAVMHASGSVDTGSGNVSGSGWEATTSYQGEVMNWDYWRGVYGVTGSESPVNSSNAVDLSECVSDGSVCYVEPSGQSYMTLSGDLPNWQVASGEQYVIMVNGDLRIDNGINVVDGGFLTLIVSGNIEVEETVTDQVEGVFIADGEFITQTDGDDQQLVVEGSVIAWTGVSLNRDFDGVENSSDPVEKFVYRPDFVENMPEEMKTFNLQWKEVAPGTYGD